MLKINDFKTAKKLIDKKYLNALKYEYETKDDVTILSDLIEYFDEYNDLLKFKDHVETRLLESRNDPETCAVICAITGYE